jgi:ubiquinone/menaquinone biosynthesis C-methylase UbiE
MAIAHLLHRSRHSASPRGATIATPRLYELTFELLTLGGRRAAFRRLLAASGASAGQRVLDVACGTGYFARLLGSAVGPSGEVVGVDAAPEMVAYARRRSRRQPTCRFEVGSAEALPFADASFDLVVSSLAMHHLPADLQPRAIAEMRRVLRPGGRVLIAEFQLPRHGLTPLMVRLMGIRHMAAHVPPLADLFTQAGFTATQRAEAAPWLFYVQANVPTAQAASPTS